MLYKAFTLKEKYAGEIYLTFVNTKEAVASDSIVEFQKKHMSLLGGRFLANDDNFQLTKHVSGPYAAMNTMKNEFGQVIACYMLPSGSHEPLRDPLRLLSERAAFQGIIHRDIKVTVT